MKAKSKWLAIFLVLGLVLAACGGNGGGSDATTTTEGATDTTEDMTTTTEGDATSTTAGGEMDIATDVGVDLEAGTITVGLLSDLSGVFSSLVQVIVTGHEVYWDNVNANGGIGGLDVVLEPADTGYDVAQHVQRYEELRDQVVAFGHSTGSPHTVAINEQLQDDGILAIPLTWYSGWSDPAINANLLHHGVPYCLEAMNLVGFITDTMGDATTIAIASNPGDYGLDSANGAIAAAEAVGLEVVYDGSSLIDAADPSTLTEVANGIVNSGADIAFVTTSPGAFGEIFGQALAQGYEGVWSGANPSFNPALLDSPIAEPLTASSFWSGYTSVWNSDNPGANEARQLLVDAGVDTPVSAYFEGIAEAQIMHAALQQAFDNGDLTQAGVLAAAKSLENVEFNGLAPNEAYVGDPNDQVQRTSAVIFRPDPEGRASGESAGEEVLETDYAHPITEGYEFTEACYTLGS